MLDEYRYLVGKTEFIFYLIEKPRLIKSLMTNNVKSFNDEYWRILRGVKTHVEAI